MPRQRLRRQPRAQTREEILDAAQRVFAQRGFHGASVEAVSEEAGFSTGAIYSNFKGKEELFLTLYEERIQRRRRELRDEMARAGGGEAGLASVAVNSAEAMEQESDWFLLYFEFLIHAARDPAFAERLKGIRGEGLAELAQGVADGLAQAELESSLDPQDLARAIRALSYGLALDQVVGDKVPDQLMGAVLQALFAGLRAEGEAKTKRRRKR
jgi:AcrR family transcriptional regulator